MLSKSFLGLAVLFAGLSHSLKVKADNELLEGSEYKEISFDDIPKTAYTFEKNQLSVVVKKSSSVKMKAFEKIKTVKSVSFEYQIDGKLDINNEQQHREKSGDDALFRVGLLRSGDAPSIPFFAPAWIKKSSSLLKLPSDKLIYLVLSPVAKGGSRWESPYSSSIENIALNKKEATEKGWQKASYQFDKPIPIVGYWLMADGDNTSSSFSLKVRNLNFY